MAIVRSIIGIALVVLSLLLPHRWMWPVSAFVASIIIAPHGVSRREILKRDGLLIFGSTLVFIAQPLLDPIGWIPWVLIIVFLLAVRDYQRWRRGSRLAAAILIWPVAFLLIQGLTFPKTSTSARTGTDRILVCLGDSLTSGVGKDDADTYVAELRKRLGCRVINAGRANDRVADALGRLDRDVLSHHPDAVLVFIGGNDGLDGTPRATFAPQFDQLIKRIATSGAIIVVVEVPAGILINPFAGLYRRTADRYGAELVPESWLRFRFMLELLFKDQMSDPMTIDGIHLSPHGAKLVASWLEPYVRGALAGN